MESANQLAEPLVGGDFCQIVITNREKPIQTVAEVKDRRGQIIQPKSSRPWQDGDLAGDVQQYLVHPGGNRLVLLTKAAVYALELPK